MRVFIKNQKKFTIHNYGYNSSILHFSLWIVHNSRKNSREIYREFFSKNDLVVSGCFSFPWGPRWVKNISNKFILKSCVPLRCYVGIRERKDEEITFETVANLFCTKSSHFEQISLQDILKDVEDLCVPLRNFLKRDE